MFLQLLEDDIYFSPLEGELVRVEQEIYEQGLSIPLTAQALAYEEELHNMAKKTKCFYVSR